jgi:class 3 adenylate cyclase
MINPIFRYEGIITRLMGDAVLAFFGTPIAHENDLEQFLSMIRFDTSQKLDKLPDFQLDS